MTRILMIVGVAALASGCTTLGAGGLPDTPGAKASSYGYVPLDPLSVDQTQVADSCKELGENGEVVPLLEALPDLAIRFAVADIDASGGLTFGPSKVTAEGGTYRAVLDYVNVDAVPVDFLVRKRIGSASHTIGWESASYRVKKAAGEYLDGYDVRILDPREPQFARTEKDKFQAITVPVYVGVGLRLSADIRAAKGNINLSGLGVIGAQAEAKSLNGTLTVQTLGVNGSSLAMALPLPNKLDQTTIEAGILAIGSSRAMLYTAGVSGTAAERIIATPRVVGLYSPIGSDPALINAIYSELSRVRPRWNRPCQAKKPKT